jgi:prepilin-type N-terminal cleavage/methylation domain-containing protein
MKRAFSPHARISARQNGQKRSRGFTLVELLTVMVIIIIIMSVTIGIERAVSIRQANAHAMGDLETLGAALQKFKLRWGEYPPGDSSPQAEINLAKALTGRARWIKGPDGRLTWDSSTAMSQPIPDWGKPFIETAKFTFEQSPSGGLLDQARILDPWADAYLYRYKSLTDVVDAKTTNVQWKAPGFVLLSRGPDRKPTTEDTNFPYQSTNMRGVLRKDYFDNPNTIELNDNLVQGMAPP